MARGRELKRGLNSCDKYPLPNLLLSMLIGVSLGFSPLRKVGESGPFKGEHVNVG
ncbi:hypothetical protein IMY05_015G0050200 [Salix suchowensis]|nr:hypothetical protein IMY05_015G0050200 [Salix suchowensis]